MQTFVSTYVKQKGKSLFLTAALLCFPFLSFAQKTSSVTGEIKGLTEGKLQILVRTSETKWDTISTTPFSNGMFSFSQIKVARPMFARISVVGYQGGFNFFLEPNATYKALLRDGDGWFITGGELQNAQTEYQKGCSVLQNQLVALQAKSDSLRKALKYGSASKVNDSISTIKKELDMLRTSYLGANNNILSAALVLQELEQMDAPLNACKELYAQLGEGAKASSCGEIVNQRIQRLEKISRGSKAPDFTLPTLDGKNFTLSAMQGKVKIVDFWASWCGPCRLNNPVLRQLYADFHSKGLEIVNVSLDEKRDRWVEAVKQDKLVWTQVSSLKGWKDPVTQLYSITAIPAIFVLDADNNIIASGLHGEELKNFVSGLFAEKGAK